MNIKDAAEHLGCKAEDIVKVYTVNVPKGASKTIGNPYVYIASRGKSNMAGTCKMVSLGNMDFIHESFNNGMSVNYYCYIDKKNYKKFSKIIRDLCYPDVKAEYAKLSLSDDANNLLNKHLIPFMNAMPLFKKHKLPMSTGVLLYGPPGTGKTSLVNSVATTIYNMYKFPYYEMNGHNIRNNDFTSKNATVLFDDVDVNYFNRQSGGEIANNLLRYLDGANKTMCQIRFFTTNEDLVDIDPAFLRPGRIDRKIYVGPPSFEQVKEYYGNMADEVKNIIGLNEWVLQVEGFNFAQMAAIYAYILRRIALDNVRTTVKEAIEFCEFERTIKWKD